MMPIYHPGAVVRNPLRRKIFVDDLRCVKLVCEAVAAEAALPREAEG